MNQFIHEIGNVGSEEIAKKIHSALNGKTYFNFNVQYASMAGNYPVIVSCECHPDSFNDAKDMMIFKLACSLRKPI